jgi:hypothetical protein
MSKGTLILFIWVLIGALAAGQRGYYSSSHFGCTQGATIARTHVPFGENPLYRTGRGFPAPPPSVPNRGITVTAQSASRMEVMMSESQDQFGGQEPASDTDQFGGQEPASDTDQFGGQEPASDTDQFGGQEPASDTDQFGGQEPDTDTDQFGGQQ